MSSEFIDLYRTKKVYLWVEDVETRAYLKALWPTENIGILVAPGAKSVQAAVHEARKHGLEQVFGISDRDFGKSNQQRWMAADFEGHFVLPFFEIENVFLNAESLSFAHSEISGSAKSATTIHTELLGFAHELTWWVAIRRTIASIRDAAFKGTPSHPRPSDLIAVKSVNDAAIWLQNHAADSSWSVQLGKAAQAATAIGLSQRLPISFDAVQTELHSGDWVLEWPGKELFRQAVSQTLRYQGDPNDIVRLVAASQKASNNVHESLEQILAILQCAAMSSVGS